MTHMVVGDMNNFETVKTVTFPEPTRTNSVIAVEGENRNEILISGLRMKCVATRPGSGWNFVSAHNDSHWSSIRSDGVNVRNFTGARADWNQPVYNGPREPVFLHTSFFPQVFDQTPLCGPPPPDSATILPLSINEYFGLRREVNNTIPVCTPSPSLSPGQPCDFGTVTCCFAGLEEIVQVVVNNIDVTSSVVGDLQDYSSTKSVSFPEPAVPAVLAFKLFSSNLVAEDIEISCQASRAGSAWTFGGEVDPAWRFVNATGRTTNTFPSDVMLNGFYGRSYSVQHLTVPLSMPQFSLLPATDNSVCSIPPSALVRPVPTSTQYNVVRKFVYDANCNRLPIQK